MSLLLQRTVRSRKEKPVCHVLVTLKGYIVRGFFTGLSCVIHRGRMQGDSRFVGHDGEFALVIGS